MKAALFLAYIFCLIRCAFSGESLVAGEDLPAQWLSRTIAINSIDYARGHEGRTDLPSQDGFLRSALLGRFGPNPANWPDAVQAAREHELVKTTSSQQMSWLLENDQEEAMLLEKDLNDPIHFWLRIFNRDGQPLTPGMVRLSNLDIYFQEVFPFLCLWLQNDIDGSIPQPELPTPPEPPEILMQLQSGLPQEEIIRISQSKEFQEAVQAYQAESLAFQQAMGNPQESMRLAYRKAQENWLDFNRQIRERFMDHLEAKSFTIATMLLQGYSTTPVGTLSSEESESLYEGAKTEKQSLTAQLNEALEKEADVFRRTFFSNLESRFGQYSWQDEDGTSRRSLRYALALEESAFPSQDDLFDVTEHLLGRNSISVEGFAGLESVKGESEDWKRKTVGLKLTSGIAQHLLTDSTAPVQVLQNEPNFLIIYQDDPYMDQGTTLYLTVRGIPMEFGHQLTAGFAAGGKGSMIDSSETKRALANAFKEAFVATAGALYADLPPWPRSLDAEDVATIGLTARVEPKEIQPDGESIVTVHLRTLEYPPGRDTVTKPYPNITVELSLSVVDGQPLGRLSSNSVTTDALGEAAVNYRVPHANELHDGSVSAITITARVPDLELEDTAYVNFTSDKGTVFVEPHYSGIVSDHGIIPADSRFPATIQFRLEDEDLNLLSGGKVTFRVESADPVGRLFSAAGEAGTTVEVTTGTNGFAEVMYRLSNDINSAEPITESILIDSPGMLRSQRAKVSVGMDLAVTGIRNLYEGKGVVNAGEHIPIEVTVQDAAHPEVKDLRPVLNHWGSGGSSGDETISVQMRMEPLGNLPSYLITRMAAESYPAPEFRDRMELRIFDGKDGNTLWMRGASLQGYAGLPKLNARYEGKNYYMVTVELVDGAGNPLPDPNPANNIGYLSIPTGVPADAFTIFFLENPLGPHTPEAKVFRTVLNLMGYGSILSLADAATAINSGDMDALANVLVGELTGKITDALGASATSAADWANLYSQLSIAEQLITTFIDTEAPIGGLQERLIEAAFRKSNATGKKLIILTGDGNQHIIDKASGQPIQVREDILTGNPGDAACLIKRGPVTVIILPEDFSYEAINAQTVREFEM